MYLCYNIQSHSGFTDYDGMRSEINGGNNWMDHLHMTHEEALKAAPAEEPGRQQFFMERCRQLIDEKKRRDETYRGTFHIETFGCPTV